MFNFESFLVERNTQVELLQKDFEKLGYEKFDYPTSTTLAVYVPKADRKIELEKSIKNLQSKGAQFDTKLKSSIGGISFKDDSNYNMLKVLFKPDQSKDLTTDEHESLSAFFIALKLKNSNTNYSEEELVGLPVESAFDPVKLFRKASPGWIHSSKNHAERLYRTLKGKQFIVCQRSKSPFVDAISKRAANLLNDANQNMRLDKWNPADIWLVHPGLIKENFKNINSIFELNLYIKNKFDSRELVGVSLKQAAGKQATAKIFNYGRFGLKEINYDGIQLAKRKLSGSIQADILYNGKERLVIRSFTNRGLPSGEIQGKFAQGGKVGFNQMHYYLKQCYNQHSFTPKTLMLQYFEANPEKFLGDLYTKAILLDPSVKTRESKEDFVKEIMSKRQPDHYVISKAMSMEIAETFTKIPKDTAACAIRRFISYAASSTDHSSVFIKVL